MTEPELLLSHRDFVRAVAAEIVGDAGSIDDVEQETLLAAWQRGDVKTRSWRAFLATLARNFARQFQRGERRRKQREQIAAVHERTPSVADVVAREEQRRAVVAAVLALDEPCRGAVLLRFYEGLAPREIARRLEIPTETARTRVKRGVEQVRARLLAGEEGLPRRLLAWLVPLARPISHSLSGLPSASQVAALAAAGILVAALAWSGLRQGGWLRAVNGSDERERSGATEVGRANASASRASDSAANATRATEPAATSGAAIETPAPTQRFSGRVVDGRSVPVVGASVFAWPDILDEPVAIGDLRATKSARGPTSSGADGRFELVVPDEVDRCTLFATATGLSPGTVLAAAAGSDVTIVLEEDDALVGVVTDVRGNAIEGARLHAWGMHGGAIVESDATARADGSYRLDYPVADRAAWQGDGESWRWWVEVAAAGFAPRVVARERDLDPDRTAGEMRCDIVLLQGATFTGAVVDAETQAPISDARAVLVAFEGWESFSRNVGGTLPNPRGQRVLRESHSDEAGLFKLEHLPSVASGETADRHEHAGLPMMMNVYVSAAGYAPAFTSASLLADGGSEEKRVELWRPATIVGRVVDADHRPLAHVRVSATEVVSKDERLGDRMPRTRAGAPACVGSEMSERVRTDANGRYEIGGLPANRDADVLYWVALDDYDWKTQQNEGAETIGVNVLVRAGAAVTAPDLVGVPERSILLDVVDEQGHAIADAQVHREPRSFDVRHTDATGQLRWIEPNFHVKQGDGWVQSFDTIRLRVSHRGFATTLTEPIRPDKSDAPRVHVVMARGHVVRGIVVDPLLRPTARAVIGVWRRPPTDDERAKLVAGHGDGDPTLQLSGTASDGDGRFVIDDLPDGTFFLEVDPPVAWQGKRPGKPATLADVRVDGAPITLRLADK